MTLRPSALLFASLAASCTCAAPVEDVPVARNVVIVVIDTLRADHLQPYGYAKQTSPRLQALSEQSVVFDRAYAHAPWTKPSVATLLTSLPPRDHGIADWDQPLQDEHLTLALHLQTRATTRKPTSATTPSRLVRRASTRAGAPLRR